METPKYFLIPADAIITEQTGAGDQKFTIAPFSSNPPVLRLQDDIERLNKNKALNPDERWKAYENIFLNYFRQKHIFDAPPRQTAAAEDTSLYFPEYLVQEILDKLPGKEKITQKRAQKLLLFLAKNPQHKVSWNETGKMIYFGKVIPGANLKDLVNYAVRFRKITPIPSGWSIFLEMLTEANAPKDLIHPNRRSSSSSKKPHSNDNDDEDDEEPTVVWETYS